MKSYKHNSLPARSCG